MSRNLTLAALAILAQGCQQPEQDVGNLPQAQLQPRPIPEQGDMAINLSFWGVGIPSSGTVGGAAARFEGVLSSVGNCLVVTAPNGKRVQPVFPAGKASWNESAATLSFGGKQYRLGDRIALGGGGVSSSSAYAREPGVRIADCPVDSLFAVIG